jgi:hypothetical protein
MNPDKLAQIKAEVKVIRAYDYFNLSFYWSDVPLTTHVLTVNEANNIPRNAKSEVTEFVIKELQESIPKLPVTRPDSEHGRITKGGALAILGRVLMAEKNGRKPKTFTSKSLIWVSTLSTRVLRLFSKRRENRARNTFL